jgi:DNA-binding helix-hairpin-helix protein with protein kinase domain
MSDKNEQHPVPATLDAFQKVFDAIVDVALIGRVSETEDAILADIVDQLHNLHQQFSEREILEALTAEGFGDGENAQALKQKLETRLVMQADIERGEGISELATMELFNNLDETKAN